MSKKTEEIDLSKLSNVDYMAYTGEAYDAIRHMTSGAMVHVQVVCSGRKNSFGNWLFNLRYFTSNGHSVMSANDWDLVSLSSNNVLILLVRNNAWKRKEDK